MKFSLGSARFYKQYVEKGKETEKDQKRITKRGLYEGSILSQKFPRALEQFKVFLQNLDNQNSQFFQPY